MNIGLLITAAEKIDSLAEKQEAKTEAWRELARDARNGLDHKEIALRKQQLDELVVIDFGTAIDELRAALHAHPGKEVS